VKGRWGKKETTWPRRELPILGEKGVPPAQRLEKKPGSERGEARIGGETGRTPAIYVKFFGVSRIKRSGSGQRTSLAYSEGGKTNCEGEEKL